MSYEAAVTMRVGEARPLYGALEAEDGSLTISAATVTLYDSAGAVAGAISGAAVTGYDDGARSTVRAWYRLATVALTAGWYRLVFSITATGSDGISRIYRPELLIDLQGVP